MKYLVAIIGPTGVGKSRLAIHLAKRFNGEIVNADSRQVYRYMDIGTAKPSPEKRASVPHHLFDIVNPDESFSLAQYQEMAYRVIDEIHQRRRLTFLVGGSGQYVWAVLEGWRTPQVPPDLEFRQKLETRQPDELYQELLRVDPATAQKIDPHNVRRVIRALEVNRQTGVPFSKLQLKKPPSFESFIIGLTLERKELYRRIDHRVDEMTAKGLIAEVENLLKMGYGLDLPAMSSIGYKQIGMFLKGEISREDAIQQIKYESHRFVRHQYAWFRLEDKRIHWFNAQNQAYPELETAVADFSNGLL